MLNNVCMLFFSSICFLICSKGKETEEKAFFFSYQATFKFFFFCLRAFLLHRGEYTFN